MDRSSQVRILIFLGFSYIVLAGCQSNKTSILGTIPYPESNTFNPKKAELGKKLFFDTRLSLDNSVSCATCHIPELAFTDGKKLSTGVYGRLSMRNAPSLLNVTFQKTLMADGQVPSLEMQALVPLQDMAEMANHIKTLLLKLSQIEFYKKAAKDLFNRDFDSYVLTRSLANFQRTLISDNSPFDRYIFNKEKSAISATAKRGWKIFSKELHCTKCHTPPLFTNLKVENNGLYADYSNISDKGRFRINADSSEIGSFKVPSLRNISLTAPYMHDGNMKTLDDVLVFYSKGGNGHVNQSSFIVPFDLTPEKKAALKEFLHSLEGDK
jgi:cytochrome c peroxidase